MYDKYLYGRLEALILQAHGFDCSMPYSFNRSRSSSVLPLACPRLPQKHNASVCRLLILQQDNETVSYLLIFIVRIDFHRLIWKRSSRALLLFILLLIETLVLRPCLFHSSPARPRSFFAMYPPPASRNEAARLGCTRKCSTGCSTGDRLQ